MTALAILAGGPSNEHEVSLQTGANMLSLLAGRGHVVRPVLVGHDGGFRFGRVGQSLADLVTDAGPGEPLPRALAKLVASGEVAVLALHGRFGEDGTLQAELERAGIPFTGSGSHASAIGMDKELSKLAATRVGAHCAAHELVTGARPGLNRVLARLGLPCVTKPVAGGSSVGVSIVREEGELPAAVQRAAAEDVSGRVLVEAHVAGCEATCAVLRRGGQVLTLPVVVIRPKATFYDYHAKYVSEETVFECPAALPQSTLDEIARVSRELHAALQLRGAVRVDFLVRAADSAPVFLELNTLPGFTGHSLVPLAARAAGLDPADVLQAALDEALTEATA